MYKDIAIIGVNFRLPQADNMDQLHDNLVNKKDCICKVSEKRKELVNLDPNKEYIEVGYIEGIQCFDNKFFNISGMEASYMCPEQRICLEMAAGAIMDAGYSLETFRGTNCAVYVSSTDNEYKHWVGQNTGAAFTGNLKSLTAGKISYYLDLHGPSLTLDASCASTLVDVHEGCMKLINEECRYSLVGGVSVNIYIPEYEDENYNTLGVVARDGRSKSFDAKAQGTGIGEGGGFILLKRLADALADHDYIYGIIKGSAINGDGSRSNSLTAPSAIGQKEVITKAWARAGIAPEEITDIEAHGTGTLIGDPIEIEGLQNSFLEYTDKKMFVYLSAVKSSIGHLAATAGIASIIKCITQYEKNVTYPIVHFNTPNPFIDFEKTCFIPLSNPVFWNSKDKRLTGINSFGFSGTNVHVVLQNYPKKYVDKSVDMGILKISAKSENSLEEYRKKLIGYFSQPGIPFYNAVFTLNTGRDDYKFRTAITFKTKEDILENLIIMPGCSPKEHTYKLAVAITASETTTYEEYLHQVEYYKLLKRLQLTIDYLFTDAYGKLVIRAVDEDIIATDVELSNTKKYSAKDYSSVLKSLEHFILLIQFGNKLDNKVIDNFIKLIELSTSDYSQLELVKALYEYGLNIHWETLYESHLFAKVPVPTYAFEKHECWIYSKEPISNTVSVNSGTSKAKEREARISFEEYEKELKIVWSDVLDEGQWGEEESFFDLGGNSLTGMMLFEELEKKWNLKISFEELYDHETFKKIKALIWDAIERQSVSNEKQENEFLKIDNMSSYSLNSLQAMIYDSCVAKPGNSTWNLSMAIEMRGELDIHKLRQAVRNIVDNHDNFRTVFHEDRGELRQSVLSEYNYELKEINLSGDNEEVSYDKALSIINEHANKQLPFINAVPFSIELFRVSENFNILFMNVHHLIGDGSTLVLFAKALNNIYNDLPHEKALYQQVDFNMWKENFIKSTDGENQEAFWKQKLKDLPESLFIKKYEDYRVDKEPEIFGDMAKMKIDSRLYKEMAAYAKMMKCSLFNLTLFAYHIWISKVTAKRDVYCLTAAAKRKMPECQTICGCLVDAVMTRTIFDDYENINDALSRARDNMNQSLNNQEYPFLDLIKKIRKKDRFAFHECAEFLMVFQNYKSTKMHFGDLILKEINIDKKGCKTDFAFTIAENDSGMYGFIEYDNSKYPREVVEEFIEEFEYILQYICQHSTENIAALFK